MKTLLLRIALLLLVLGLPAALLRAQNVIIVVVDGLRASEGMDADSTHLPRIWNELRPAGMIWPSFRNEGVTTTVSGHASVLTGSWQNLPNDGSARPTAPTLFEFYRRHTAAPESATFVVSGKAKLSVLTHGTDSAFGAPWGARFVLGAGDTAVMARTREVLSGVRPRLVLVNLADVDVAGHSGNWQAYLAAIRRADSLVHGLWRFLEADSFYRGTTTLFVTNDHGRHDNAHGGFQNHGDGCEGCRRIMLAAVGRGIPAGLVPQATRTQRDIAPAAAALLGISAPGLTGAGVLEDTAVVHVDGPPEESAVPGLPRLEHSWPNPFNPSATLSVVLPEPSHVRLTVVDLLGRHVTTLAEAEFPAGSMEVVWDARGRATGTYLARLEAGGHSSVRKLVLVR